jgi:hypothetical protein
MNIGTFSLGMKYVMGLAGTGPWGIGAMIAGLLALVGAAAYYIAKANKQTDASELDQGGADAGITAQALKNQADQNRDFEKRAREDFDAKS